MTACECVWVCVHPHNICLRNPNNSIVKLYLIICSVCFIVYYNFTCRVECPGEDRSQKRLRDADIYCYSLGDASDNRRPIKMHTMDPLLSTESPWFCWWSGSGFPHLQIHTGDNIPPQWFRTTNWAYNILEIINRSMTLHVPNPFPIQVYGKALPSMEEFTYHGSSVRRNGEHTMTSRNRYMRPWFQNAQ